MGYKVTAVTAARLCGRSPRSVWDWIDKGWLGEVGATVCKVNNAWQIDTDDLQRLGARLGFLLDEDLLRQVGHGSVGVSAELYDEYQRMAGTLQSLREDLALQRRRLDDYLPRLQALEAADLSTRLARLEEAPPPGSGITGSSGRSRRGTPRDLSAVTVAEGRRGVPAGSVMVRVFARDHNVPGGTIGAQISERKFPTIALDIGARDKRNEYWLAPHMFADAIRYWDRVGTSYTPCAECPHEWTEVPDEDRSWVTHMAGGVGHKKSTAPGS